MTAVLDSLLAGLPHLVLHLGVTLGMLGAAAWVYMRITPHDELALIRGGNVSAAISFAAALLGLAIPLAACLATSIGVWDIVIWGVVTLILQLLALRVIEALLDGLWHRIEADELGAAVLLAAVKLSVALVNAAAISG